ncbi:MAG: hypothetical protein ACRD18_16600 [Terriglobia bacterium]
MRPDMIYRRVCGMRLLRLIVLALILFAAPALVCSYNEGGAQSSSGDQEAAPARRTFQNPPPGTLLPSELPATSNPLSLKQKDAILKANFKSTQRDVEKLSKLVQALDQEMKKSNPNVLSVSIVQQADKIEKLARKIKNEARSY